MTKKLFCFGCASVGLLVLSACGSTNNVLVDQSDVWHGGGNAVQTGGYWFSYTDHVQWMKDNTGWDPNDSHTKPRRLDFSTDQFDGFDANGARSHPPTTAMSFK